MKKLMKLIRSSVRNKFLFIFISIIIIPTLFTISVSYEVFVRELRSSYTSNNVALLNQLNKRLDDYFLLLGDYSLSVGINDTLSDLSSSQNWALSEKKLKELTALFFQRKETNSILFYYPISKEAFVINKSTVRYFQNADDIEQLEWYRESIQRQNTSTIRPTHNLTGYASRYMFDHHTPVFSLERSFTTYMGGKVYGVLCVNYETDVIENICRDMISHESERIFYLDKGGDYFYASGEQDNEIRREIFQKITATGEPQGAFEYLDSGRIKRLVVYCASDSTGNILYKSILSSEIYEKANSFRNTNLTITIFVFLVFVAMILALSNRIIKPLSVLESTMKKVGDGDFSTAVPVVTTDEIGRISNSFNIMTARIDGLINEKYRMQMISQMAQIKALQAQINPHFLYNTLQTIGSVSLKEGKKDLYNMTIALSNMLRYSIKAGNELVTIKDEIGNVQDYLYIQKYRFKERLDYTIEIPEELYPLKLPKLTFQPIVENAIVHGIEQCKAGGKIIIRCSAERGQLHIVISDNGAGIEPGELERLQSELHRFNEDSIVDSDKIGILNTYHRLRLKLGENCRMSIGSVLGEGTNVDIWLDMIR